MVVAFTIKEKKLFKGKPILPIGAAAFLFIFVVLSSQFGCAIGLVSGIATKAAIVLSIFSFTNCSGYSFMLIFSEIWEFITMVEIINTNDINTITDSIRKNPSFVCIYDGVIRRAPVSNVGTENGGSAGQAGFAYQVLV